MNSLVHNYFWVHKENVAIKDSAYAKPSFISNKKPQSHPSNKKELPIPESWPSNIAMPLLQEDGREKKVKHYGKRLCRPLPTVVDFDEFCPKIMRHFAIYFSAIWVAFVKLVLLGFFDQRMTFFTFLIVRKSSYIQRNCDC